MDTNSNKGKLLVPPIPVEDNHRNQPSSDKDLSFVKQFSGIVSGNLKNVPGLLKENFLWMIPLLVLWIFLGSLSEFTRFKLPGFLNALISLLIFLTATYNNFLGKALFGGFIGGIVMPLIKETKSIGFGNALKGRIQQQKRTVQIVMNAFKEKGKTGYIMMLGFGGLGFAFANLLSRNSKIDKYLVVLLTSIGLLNALSHGLNDPIVKLVRAFWHDVSGAAKSQKNTLSVSNIYIAVASFVFAMAASVVFAFVHMTNSFYDPTGYIVGGVCLIVSIVWYVAGNKKNEKKTV